MIENSVKIFCLGLPKTGTSSLHRALEILGIESMHDFISFDRLAKKAILENKNILHYMNDFQAYTNIILNNLENSDLMVQIKDIENFLNNLKINYPKTKFILTTRKLNEWLESVKKHSQRRPENLHGIKNMDLSRWLQISSQLETEFNLHNNLIRKYFKDQPNNLLVIDITAGDGWEKLCPFLGLPISNVPFPNENKAPIIKV